MANSARRARTLLMLVFGMLATSCDSTPSRQSGGGGTGATNLNRGPGGPGGEEATAGSTGGGAIKGAGGTSSGDVGGGAGGGGGEGSGSSARRLPLPCAASVPTGFCLQTDSGDASRPYQTYSASGPSTVKILTDSLAEIEVWLLDPTTTNRITVRIAAPATGILAPGLYAPVGPFEVGGSATASIEVSGVSGQCLASQAKFSIEELWRGPLGDLTRLSLTIDEPCQSSSMVVRGVVNLEATGKPDPTLLPERTILLQGKIAQIAYDPVGNIAYGLDATHRRLAKIDLANGNVSYADVVQVPNAACVDGRRGRLFVVNKGSTLIGEYSTADLSLVRTIPWTGTDTDPNESHFKILCAPDRLYVADCAWQPGLVTIEGLDGTNPAATDHTSQVPGGVGGLALNAAGTSLYTWDQLGWSAGGIDTAVRRLSAVDFTLADMSATDLAEFGRDPLDTPILLDEGRGLVLVKNKVFDATKLSTIVYTLPAHYDTFKGASENAYALDAQRGLFASKGYIYGLDHFDIVSRTLVPTADQSFFDASGRLWFLSSAEGTLKAQIVQR